MARSVKIYDPVRLAKIRDADTVEFDIDLGLNAWLHGIPVRIDGIDTPETFGVKHVSEEYRAGMEAKARLTEYFAAATGPIKLHTYKLSDEPLFDKYGRILADVFIPIGPAMINLGKRLLVEKHARAYNGGTKLPWSLLRPLGRPDPTPLAVSKLADPDLLSSA